MGSESSALVRSFLYLDARLLNDYLAAVDGSVLQDQTIKETRDSVGKGGGSFGFKGLGLDASRESSSGSEITRVSSMNDAARFQRLYAALQAEDCLPYFEVMAAETWNGISRGQTIEAAVSMRFSKMRDIFRVVENVGSLGSLIQQVTGESVMDSKVVEAVAGFQSLAGLQKNKGIPCVFSFVGSPEFKLVSYLSPAYLLVPEEQFLGEVNLVCKIQRKLQPGDSIELVDLIPGLNSLPMNRETKRKMPKGAFAPPEFRDTIRSPAAVVHAIAVYL